MSKWYSQISWQEVPHLSEEAKKDLLSTIPEYQRESRTKGIPVLGSGLIYPMDPAEFTEKDFPIPDHYKRLWALDTGWNWTAVVWGAQNPDDKVIHLYSCYKRAKADPETHAAAIKSRGSWIPGIGDASDINKLDGRQTIAIYRDTHGLDIELPIKAVEAGIYQVWCDLCSGKLKVFASLNQWFEEFRFYARADDGKGTIIKNNDHLMDATRYLVMSKMDRAVAAPIKREAQIRYVNPEVMGNNWMGA
jgi:hypothetical protein